MCSDIVIEVANLSKCYEIYDEPRDRLKQAIYPKVQTLLNWPQKKYFDEFWALRNVSFEVGRGETVGIIGRNGSGKSTLLQLICGTLHATSGIIKTKGRIGALLELGSGFSPDFTGRENIYMNALLLGLSEAEVDERYDDIVSFADIGTFIEQPVKMYSSGMMVRLAFAVQAQTQPDILIVDEALAVGDAKFQAKCFERLRQLKENGTSILLVTHSSEQIVSHCTSAILLERGEQIFSGEPRSVVNRYLDLLFGKQHINAGTLEPDTDSSLSSPTVKSNTFAALSSEREMFAQRAGYNPHEYRWGDRGATILDYYLGSDTEDYPTAINSGASLRLALSVRFNRTLIRPILGVTIKTKEGITVYGTNTELLGDPMFRNGGAARTVGFMEFSFECRFGGGDYFLSVGVASREGDDIVPHDRRYDSIHIQIKPTTKFDGLVNVGMQVTTAQV